MAVGKSKRCKLVEEASAGKTGGSARTQNGESGSSVVRRESVESESSV